MPPRKSITLTEAELRLMKILWARGESAVGELVAAMPEGAALAYNSVLTTIRILEQKGYLHRKQVDRAYVYRPAQPKNQVIGKMVRDFVNRVFNGSAEPLLVHLIEDRRLTGDEIEEIRRLIGERS